MVVNDWVKRCFILNQFAQMRGVYTLVRWRLLWLHLNVLLEWALLLIPACEWFNIVWKLDHELVTLSVRYHVLILLSLIFNLLSNSWLIFFIIFGWGHPIVLQVIPVLAQAYITILDRDVLKILIEILMLDILGNLWCIHKHFLWLSFTHLFSIPLRI
jgi:hypothetical protein